LPSDEVDAQSRIDAPQRKQTTKELPFPDVDDDIDDLMIDNVEFNETKTKQADFLNGK
jgi:hypothetical protein